jgi:malate dehydrogenase (oxaloacetate-decarboxylating)
MSDIGEESLHLHREQKGKIATKGKVDLSKRENLALAYTPGVGAVSTYLSEHPEEAGALSVKGNSIAVVSDGSAVLGLGNIGPYGALPVMEGKALIFKEFADIDAWPIVLSTQDPEEIIKTVIAIAPSFAGINLEDIAAPQCFEIEKRLIEALDMPVMHDDQHGTAIVVLAGLINAAKVVEKELEELRVVVLGAGAAGVATAKLLVLAGIPNVIVVDRMGVVSKDRPNLNEVKLELANLTNPRNIQGPLTAALRGADAVIGLSGANKLQKEDIMLMGRKAIVFALANPTPEIMPDDAYEARAYVVATGRSDFPNQINNALVFPGVFRGALTNGVRRITEEMKLAAAYALAGLIKEPTVECIVPDIFDERVVATVSEVIR